METSFFARILTDHDLRTICWTLVHSVWIGIVIAVIAALMLMATRKSASWIRYQLLCGCLFGFVMLTGFVFYTEFLNQVNINPEENVYQNTLPNIQVVPGMMIHDENLAYLNEVTQFIDKYSAWIFTIWLAFFVIKSVRMGGGLLYIYRIRSRRTHVAGEHWEQRLNTLAENLGIRKTIGLLQSELVKVPVTVGHFKPVILIPVGMILQLPYGQIETILIHELAHIRRKDYLVNLLQTVLETVFFFNPGLLWLSVLIREERENCCDDMVLANTSGKTNYLEALLAFHQYDNKPNKLTMALSLRGNQLVNRLKRIINQENKRISIMEKIVLFAGMLGISAFCFISAPKSPAEESKALLRLGNVKADMPLKRPEIPTFKNKINVEPVISLDVVAEKVVPDIGEDIEKEPIADTTYKFKSIRFYSNNEDGANRDMAVSDDQNNFYELKVTDNKLTGARVNGVEIAENDLPKYQDLLSQVDKTWKEGRERKHRLMERDRERFEKERRQELAVMKEGRERKEFNKRVNWEKRDNGDWVRDKKKDKTEWKMDKNAARDWKGKDTWVKTKSEDWDKEKFKLKAKWTDEASMRRTPGVKRMPEPKDISVDQERVRGIISELVDNKVIKEKSNLEWFGLSETELIVNGEKQSEELQRKLKEKYNIRYGQGLYYGPVKMTGKGIFLDKGNL